VPDICVDPHVDVWSAVVYGFAAVAAVIVAVHAREELARKVPLYYPLLWLIAKVANLIFVFLPMEARVITVRVTHVALAAACLVAAFHAATTTVCR
jgi:hypothetical protein